MDRKSITNIISYFNTKFNSSKAVKIFYFDMPDAEMVVEYSNVMHEMKYIPWPDMKCIIIFPALNDPSVHIGYYFDGQFLYCYNPQDKNNILNGQKIKLSTFDGEYVRTGNIYDFYKENYKDIEKQLPKYSGIKANTKFTQSLCDEVCVASSILTNLVNLVSPCGYKVTAKIPIFSKKGKEVSNYKVESIIRYDRFYKMCQQVNAISNKTYAPHPRRGHLRYWWKYSGIDRRNLPENPTDRIRLAFENNVKTSYIKPTFCHKEFSVDNISIKIE